MSANKKKKVKPFSLTVSNWAIHNYMQNHGVYDAGIRLVIIKGFLKEKQQSDLNFKDGIKYITEHFGLFAQYANNSKVQLNNLKKARSEKNILRP